MISGVEENVAMIMIPINGLQTLAKKFMFQVVTGPIVIKPKNISDTMINASSLVT